VGERESRNMCRCEFAALSGGCTRLLTSSDVCVLCMYVHLYVPALCMLYVLVYTSVLYIYMCVALTSEHVCMLHVYVHVVIPVVCILYMYVCTSVHDMSWTVNAAPNMHTVHVLVYVSV